MKQYIYSLDTPIVQTKAGLLRGFVYDGIYTFHGIKYADAQRFQPPVPIKPWEGVREATSYGYICPVPKTSAPSGEQLIPHRFWPEHEHCQYLNIWSPALGADQKKPVMVWLHGGGYEAGSSIEQVAYEGDALAKHGDVVVVTLNHRLNILGFLDLSSFSKKYANSVNAGLADIVAALEWVRDNIAAFGGDPENVTLFGQSGGGGKVEALMQTPAADGLFHKAIIMSGILTVLDFPPTDQRPLVEGILKELNITVREVEKLEKVPYYALSKAAERVRKRMLKEKGIYYGWCPVANDWYSGAPMKVGFREHAKTIPTIVGTVMSEFTIFGAQRDGLLTDSEKEEKLKALFGSSAETIQNLMRKTYPDKDPLSAYTVDLIARPCSADWAAQKDRVSAAPVYLYQFALTFDLLGGLNAWHCSDIPFVFHNTHRIPSAQIPEVTERLEQQMAGAFIQFAYTGDPNHPGMPKWSPCGEHRNTMVFDRTSRCLPDFDTELLRMMQQSVKAPDRQTFFHAEEEDEEREWLF